MVRHEDVGVNDELVTPGGIEQHFLEELAVFVVGEDRLVIVAAEYDVLRYAFGEISWKSSHGLGYHSLLIVSDPTYSILHTYSSIFHISPQFNIIADCHFGRVSTI